MDHLKALKSLKCTTLEEAERCGLIIREDGGDEIGRLVPIGPWILSRPDLIDLMTDWRRNAMRFFMSRFEASSESMAWYLRTLSVGQDNRLLFLIEDPAGRFVGHIGLSGCDGQRAEIDNLMRGLSGGHPQLVPCAERTLLDWCFGVLNLESLNLKVLSYNFVTMNLHARFGFRETRRLPLRRYEKDGKTEHDEVDEAEANVDYRCVVMELGRGDFTRRMTEPAPQARP
ncbi:hypothetical protein HDIA_2611 [Hartmannibacter diazotrophicus]|uniref:N-acetyltransferase domain-containing protein n=1 Tax=Hartmannibacter diazotrophicus TaxID=1482074 RepID=A0A2C9D760_9HYPH|nr:GNAT family protein [Hartmannibacter diazotrophicus]SON56152.1 hypothetical protein HDIA_2611 [Hartmannibacter diazotrophicus]